MKKSALRFGLRSLERGLHGSGLSKAEYIRMQSVLMKKKGFSLKEIMSVTGKAQVSIQGWITEFNQHGIDGLKTKQRSHHPRSILSVQDKERIKQMMTGRKPHEYGYSGDFWSVPVLKQLVKDKLKVEYKTAKAYRDLFAYCGYSYQKAEFVDKRKDSQSQWHFKKRFEQKLKKGGISMWW